MSEEPELERTHRRVKRRYGWKLATLTLFALLIISVFTGGFRFTGAATESVIGSQEAAEQSIEFINTQLLQGQSEAVLKEVSEEGELYKITLEVQGQEFESYMTQDGQYLFPQGIDMTEPIPAPEAPTEAPETPTAEPETPEVSKSDKPVIDLTGTSSGDGGNCGS